MPHKTFISFQKNLILLLFFSIFSIYAQENQKKATWIWCPRDFEAWLSNEMQVRHTERESFFLHFRKKEQPLCIGKIQQKN